MHVLQGEPLANRTTLAVGGPAKIFYRLTSDADIVRLASELVREKSPFLVLGGGSNVVVSDKGVDCPVLAIETRGITRSNRANDDVEVTATAGEPWDAFVANCIEYGLAGVECLSGIPGLVGATPIQNVGAYGTQVSDCITEVRCYDTQSNTVVTLPADACTFGYRSSIFKGEARGRYIVLAVTFMLRRRSTAATPNYAELRDRIGAAGLSDPTIEQMREHVVAIRRSKSMVVDEKDPDSRSVGSFFLNPIVSHERLAEITKIAHTANAIGEHESVRALELLTDGRPNGLVKIPAAWLIERAGFCKGRTNGNAGLSNKHVLAIVNRGGARCDEIVALALEIQQRVKEIFGIVLAPEPVLWGFHRPPLL